MRILIVGAGATGGYYGGRLAQAGRDVTFLVRGTRLQQLRDTGIEIMSPQGDATIPVKTITVDALPSAGAFDVVIVSVKAYSLDAALEDFAPAIGPNTIVLPLLNGMRHIDRLSERFGRERVLGGSVTIVSDMDENGRIRQMTGLNHLNFGELDGKRSSRAEALLPVFAVHGITASLAEDIIATMWQKWTILSTMGAVGLISGGTVGQMMEAPYGEETALAVLHEATAIAMANGYPSPEKVYAVNRHRMTERGSTLTSSMYRDMVKGNAVEADHILGDLLARAQGAQVPLLTGAYVRLKVYEANRTKN